MLSSIKSNLSRLKRELLTPSADTASPASLSNHSALNLSLVLASPDTPPKALFDSPQGLFHLVALRNAAADALLGSSHSAAAATLSPCAMAVLPDAPASAVFRAVVKAPAAIACVAVPLAHAADSVLQLKRELEQQLVLEYEAVDDLRQAISAERERLRVLQLEHARDAARREGTLAEFDEMRELELAREAAARARDAELGVEAPQSPRSLRRERKARRARELAAEEKRVLASRAAEPVHVFRAPARCLALNALPVDALAVVVAFDGADAVYMDATSRNVAVDWSLGKCTEGAEISVVRWLPGSAEQFVAATTNGLLLWCDVRRTLTQPVAVPRLDAADSELSFLSSAAQLASAPDANPTSAWRIGSLTETERRHDSRILDKSATSCEILALEFGCGEAARVFALTCVDGSLRFFAAKPKPTFLCAARSNGGAFACLAFSPSGRYVAAGGEADTISVYSIRAPSRSARMRLPKLVSVCVGHRSFVRCVAFDAHHPARLLSGGDDCRLLLWDLQLDRDHRRLSESAGAADDADDTDDTQSSSDAAMNSQRSHAPPIAELDAPLPAVPATTTIPVAAHHAHLVPVVNVSANSAAVVSCDAAGQLRVWARPDSTLAAQWQLRAASE
jgi:hypothetical protein